MDTIHEGSSAVYTATVSDPDGAAVPLAAYTSILLTLYDEYTGNIINSRHDQDVLNANDVAIDAAGELTWQIQPEDTIILSTTRRGEWHIALFVFTWSAGRYTHRTRMRIINYAHEPASEL